MDLFLKNFPRFIAITGIIILSMFFWQKKFFAQETQKKWEMNGYISDMQSVMFDSIKNPWISDNLIHNRLNFKWYPSQKVTFAIELRNRFLWGDQIKYGILDKKTSRKDAGFIPFLAYNLVEGNSFLLTTAIDRLWAKYTLSNAEITVGRQRINWGQNFVWNPNDIFNVYSFFDFDYVERPGSDALRIQYYPSFTSTVEGAIKLDSAKKITAALFGRFNLYSYDFQFMGGILNNEEITIGIGWTGNIKSVSFSGEATYLHPSKQMRDTSGIFIASVGFNYTFPKSLFIQFEALYNSYAGRIKNMNFLEFYSGSLSVKKLSITEFSVFGAVSYPFHPLINGLLSVMYMPGIKGFYAGPSFDFSAGDNLKFSLIFQTFSGEFTLPGQAQANRQWLNLGFLRYKYSF